MKENPSKSPSNGSQSVRGGSSAELSSSDSSTKSGSEKSFAIEIPSITLPKGGGALKSIDEKFQVNAANGSASYSVPLPLSKGRSEITPSLSLSYNSGSGNSPFGLGWSLDVSSIQRKTDKQLPRYRDYEESDVFMFSGVEDLVPLLKEFPTGTWIEDEIITLTETVKRYRPRAEGSFSRIEKITPKGSNLFYWRVTSANNTVTIFGRSPSARISDPANPDHIFKWLPELCFDDRGNSMEYEYVKEDKTNVPFTLHEQNRENGLSPYTNMYLKKVKYGNTLSYDSIQSNPYNPQPPTNPGYLFEVVFDFGDHDTNNPVSETNSNWACRVDPFSVYHSGFEIRTYRICKRILFFHNFKELNDGVTAAPCLVRSLDFSYKFAYNPSLTLDIRNVQTDYITSIQQSGYIKKSDGTYSKKNLPPVEFSYQELAFNTTIHNVTSDNLIGSPVGLGQNYQWTDLWSEGISGILTEQGNGWFYKSNLGNGNFTSAEPVIPKPSFTGIQGGSLQLQDLEADGRKFIVSLQEGTKGYFELSDQDEWQPFRSFDQMPNVSFGDPNTKFIDLNGDGKPDLIISEENVFTWYPNKGIIGYDSPELAAKPYDEEKGPAIVFADSTQSILLANMSGGGMTDIVRVRNGEICYWPNMGYGKFGAKVTMEFAPLFDHPDQFNPSFLHLADVSGTGATDILYLGKNKFTAWFNLSGNAWSEPYTIDPFPTTESPNQVAVMDFLGNGTGCIVWSSPLPNNVNAPMRYIDLMGGSKPFIMSGYKNNFGKVTSWEYKSSTYFYLQDKKIGKPWVTKLPFPVQCLTKLSVDDLASGAHFSSLYSYHHGYYDYAEREFRGFGRVEQIDSEVYDEFVLSNATNIVEADLHLPPVKTISWFHTGAYFNNQRILDQFQHEYNRGPNEFDLPKPILPQNLNPIESREALRACKGMTLRQEVYAIDGDPNQDNPYSVSLHNNLIKLVQPTGSNRYAVFYVHESEALTIQYERNLLDPRIAHTLNIEVDDFGNVLKSASVVYGRKTIDTTLPPAIRDEQKKTHVIFSENSFTNDFDLPNTYRLRVPAESTAYELTNPGYDNVAQFEIDDLLQDFITASVIVYEASASGVLEKRIIEQVRTMYLNPDDLTTQLAFKDQGKLGIPEQHYKLAFTSTLLTSLYSNRVSSQMMLDAKYLQIEGNWWVASGTNLYLNPNETTSSAEQRFYLPIAVKDPFGIETWLAYDPYHLTIIKTIDALQNEASVEQVDYRTLQPVRLKDPNENISETLTDELGMVITTSVYGDESDGNHGDQPLSNYNITQPANLADVIANPQTFLQRASSFFYYDLFAWVQRQKPVCFAAIARETHDTELPSGEQSKVFLSVGYSSGLGQNLQTKVQAEPGNALNWLNNALVTVTANPRWVGTGRTILNNKGKPIKQYEPYFSTTYEYESEQGLVEIGFSSILRYDPLGRTIRVDHPNGTFSRTEFDSWKQLTYDENDTVLESTWYSDRGSPAATSNEPSDAETRAAWLAAKHANTPAQAHLDSLGRTIYTIADNAAEGQYETRLVLDIENNQKQVIDARGIAVMSYDYDMASRQAHQLGTDGGDKWIFPDAMDKPTFAWDSRNHQFRTEYDLLHRPSKQWLIEDVTGQSTEKLIGLTIYGEGQANDKQMNLRGKAYRSFDQSGLVEVAEYDFKGNPKLTSKRLAIEYKLIVDWNVTDQIALLEDEVFSSSSKFDAASKPIEMRLPDGSIVIPAYSEANLLEKMDVAIKGQLPATPFIKNIDYNAKGQREKIIYGNSTLTRYSYDEKTYRLTRLLTTRNAGADFLQDLNYTYDPVGNITAIGDDAQQTVYFNNAVVNPSCKYEYDATYRLIRALGREHAGQNAPCDQFDRDKTHSNGQPLPLKGDGAAMQNYEQRYEYDGVGNMLRMIHNAGISPFINRWVREFEYDSANNHLNQTTVSGSATNFSYDAHGNMLNLQSGAFNMIWDFADRLKEIDLGGGGIAYYTYDASGERVRKVIENGNLIKSRIYLGSSEIYREILNETLTLERETLHVMDDKSRIALIETRTLGVDNGSPFVKRYQFSNHLGTASLEMDEAGDIISYEEYYPFGSTAYQSSRNQNETPKRYRYTGKERDQESGLEYHSARYYAVWLGRWVSPDPQGLVDSVNIYVYSLNQPIIAHDPNGTHTEPTVERKVGLNITNTNGVFSFTAGLFVSDSEKEQETYTPLASGGLAELESFYESLFSGSGTAALLTEKERMGVVQGIENMASMNVNGSPGAGALTLAPAIGERFIWQNYGPTTRGKILEVPYGVPWNDNKKNYDKITGDNVDQFKTTSSTGKNAGKVATKAARDAQQAIEDNPLEMKNMKARAVINVQTDASAETINAIKNAPIPEGAAKTKVVRGLPGKVGKVGRAMPVIGSVVSALSLAGDIESGDVPMGIGDTAGTIGGGLELYAAVSPGATVAGVSAMTAGLAFGGIGIAIASGVSGYRAYKSGDTGGAIAGAAGVAAGILITAGAIFAAPVLLLAGGIAALAVGAFHLGRHFDWW